jgi:integrase
MDPKTRKRDRVLLVDELRLIWPLLDNRGTYGMIVKVALLAAQRLEKIVTMKWANLSDDGIWTVPHAHREKSVGGALALPERALQVIRTQPRIEGCDYVFAGRNE